MTTNYGERPGINVEAPTLRPERETHPRCNCGARIPMDCGDDCDDCAADAANEDAIERAIAAKHGVTL